MTAVSGHFVVPAIGAVLAAAVMLAPAAAQQQGGYQVAPVTVEAGGSTALVSGTVVPYKEVVLSAQIPGLFPQFQDRLQSKSKTSHPALIPGEPNRLPAVSRNT